MKLTKSNTTSKQYVEGFITVIYLHIHAILYREFFKRQMYSIGGDKNRLCKRIKLQNRVKTQKECGRKKNYEEEEHSKSMVTTHKTWRSTEKKIIIDQKMSHRSKD